MASGRRYVAFKLYGTEINIPFTEDELTLCKTESQLIAFCLTRALRELQYSAYEAEIKVAKAIDKQG